MKVGDRVLVNSQGEHVFGTIEEIFGTIEEIGNIKSIGSLTYDLKVKLSEYSTAILDFENVIQTISDEDVTFSAYALSKIGARTFTGSGKSKDIVANDLDSAMNDVEEWICEKHPGAEVVWKDQPNYRFADLRASGKCVLTASEKIDTGWPDSWISITLIPYKDSNKYHWGG